MLSSVGMTQATLYEQNEPRTTKVEELPAIQFTAATEPPKYLPPRCKHCGYRKYDHHKSYSPFSWGPTTLICPTSVYDGS